LSDLVGLKKTKTREYKKLTNQEHDKRRIKGAETKRLLIQSAISTIATAGLSKLTLDKVAESVGVSRANVIFHFKTKSLLIEHVLLFLGNTYQQGRERAVSGKSETTMEKILTILDYDISFACNNPQYISAWHAFWGESRGNDMYRNLSVPRDKGYAQDLKKLLSILIQEKNYKKSELPEISATLTAILFGLWVKVHLNPESGDLKNGKKSVRLFLSKVFSKHTVPG
jgi:TetR/AcrR family transcriptional repressor of bet genes